MRSYIRSGVGLGVVLGLAIAVGCSSSDDSSPAAGGTGGASAGSGGKASGGSAGSGASGKGGSSSAGTSNTGDAGTGDVGNVIGGAGGESGGSSGPDESAGAGGGDTGPVACNNLVFSGAMGTYGHAAAADLPTFTYGTPVAGNYQLTAGTLYDGGSGTEPLGGLARVTVNGQTVTIDIFSSGDAITGSNTETFQFTLGQPSTMPPTNVKLSCATLASLVSYVGMDVTGLLKYTATATTLTVYEVPFNTAYTYTLITQ